MRIVLSWASYWIGNWVSLLDVFPTWGRWGYPIYHRFMNWSDDLQGDDVRGPWGPVSPDGLRDDVKS